MTVSPTTAQDPIRFYPPCETHNSGYWQPVTQHVDGNHRTALALTSRDISPSVDPAYVRCWVKPGQYLVVMPEPRFSEPGYGSQRRSYEYLRFGLTRPGGDQSH